MINRFIAVCLLISLIASGFSRYFVYAGYEVNQQYIASTFCVNKDKPEMHCNGKCYLANKLKQAEEKEKRQAENNQKRNTQDSFFVNNRLNFTLPPCIIESPVIRDLRFDLPQRSNEILHPPPAFDQLS